MPFLHHVWQNERRNNLLMGYIKHNVSMSSISNSILQILESYYGHNIFKMNIRISQNELLRLSTKRNGFSIGDIEFYIDIATNIETIENSILLTIKLKSMPFHINQVTIYFNLSCKQTQTKFKDIHTFSQSLNEQAVSWPYNLLQKSQCSDIDGNYLDFGFEIDILQILYSNYYFQPCSYNLVNKFDYTIDKMMLRTFMTADKPFYTKIINNWWYLKFSSLSIKDTQYQISLILHNLPPFIGAIKANISINYSPGDDDNDTFNDEFTFYGQDMIQSDNINKSEYVIGTIPTSWKENICLRLIIKIQKVYDFKMRQISLNEVELNKHNISMEREYCTNEYNCKLYNDFVDRDKYVRLKWNICDDSLTAFQTTRKCEQYRSKFIKVSNIGFNVRLYPNGILSNEIGYVQFCLVLKSMPYNCKSIVIYYRLNCQEMGIKFKDIKKMDNIGSGIKWPSKSLKLSQCKDININSLTFECIIEILNIEYKYDLKGVYYYKILSMTTPIKYSWIIDETLLSLFKLSENGQLFHSERFQNCWCLDICPSGFNERDDTNLRLSLTLLALPPLIKLIKAHVILECNYNDGIRYETDFKFNYENKVVSWPSGLFSNAWIYQSFQDIDLTFSVKIKILKVYDINSKKLQPNQWCKYGIFTNNSDENPMLNDDFINKRYESLTQRLSRTASVYVSSSPSAEEKNDTSPKIEIISWNINSRQLQELRKLKQCYRFGTKQFVIANDIDGYLNLYSKEITNNRKTKHNKQIFGVCFEFNLTNIPENIIMMKLCLNMCCKQILTQDREIILYNKRKPFYGYTWNSNILLLEECMKSRLTSLDFVCRVEILQIEYKATQQTDCNEICNLPSKYIDYYKDLTTKHKIEYKWQIKGTLMDRFLKAKCGEILYSQQLENCWILSCYPNGYDMDNEGEVILSLKLIRLPLFVKSLSVRIVLKCNYDNVRIEKEETFSYQRNDLLLSSMLRVDRLRHSYSIKHLLSFKIRIYILNVINMNQLIIDKHHWTNYNILSA